MMAEDFEIDGFVLGRFFEEWEEEGIAVGLEVEEILLEEEESEYQEISVFKSKTFGNVLVIDEVIQCTERDEFPYHEMMAHLPLFCHPNPTKVLIIGGGDGGAIREIAKHSAVKEIHQCELDQFVIDVAKKYLPKTAVGYSSPKLTTHLENGLTFIDRYSEEFDVIITDCSDYDLDSSKPFYEQPYFEKVKKALKPDGIMCSLAECMFTDFEFMKTFTKTIKSVFPVVRYAYGIYTPGYIGGQCGFMVASKDKDKILEEPVHQITNEDAKEMNLRYYNTATHRACFALPQYIKEALQKYY